MKDLFVFNHIDPNIDKKHQNIILEYQRVIQKREKCNHIIYR